MARRKAPRIPDALLDQLLACANPKTAFDANGLLDDQKKAQAERALNAEMDHHLADAPHAHPLRRHPSLPLGAPKGASLSQQRARLLTARQGAASLGISNVLARIADLPSRACLNCCRGNGGTRNWAHIAQS